MRSTYFMVLSSLLLTLVGCVPDKNTKGATEITLKKIKPAEWAEVIKSYKGKVVAVELWADFCDPCKRAFPHHVEMSKKYAKDDVQFVSVSVDESNDHDRALAFLKKAGANFANFHVETKKSAEWGKLFNIQAIPLYLVYDKDGTETRFVPGDPLDPKTPEQCQEDMEKHIKKLIAKQ